MSARASSRRKRAISFQRSVSTTTVSSPASACVSRTDAGNCFFKSSTRAFDISHRGPGDPRPAKLHEAEIRVLGGVRPRLYDRGTAIAFLDLVLKQHEPIEHRLGPGRATG